MTTAISNHPKTVIQDHAAKQSHPSQTWDHNVNPFEEWDDNPFNPQDLNGLESPRIVVETIADHGEEIPAEPIQPERPQRPNFTLKRLLFSPQAAIALALIVGSMYALTRPCVIGECAAIDQAKAYSQSAEEILQTVSGAKAPGLAKQDIDEAIAELETIPFWSPYYGPARRLLSNYRQESTELGAVIAGLRFAGQAASQGQDAPYTVQEWERLKNLWEEAIAQLQQVPIESLIYPFAQQRLDQYNDAAGEVRGRLILEREAQEVLKRGKQTAQVAIARQGVATQANSWQLVYDTWQQATNTLASVQVGTTAHQDAQLLLANYQPKLEAARDRKTIEQVGQEAYDRAVNSADQAKILSERGAWSDAVKYWSRAVSYGKKIPQSSSYTTEMKPLMESYTQSWKQAEAQNKLTNRINKARQDLKKTCGGGLTVCSYSVNKDLITVRITPAYLEKIETTATQGDQSGNEKQRLDAEKHVQTLKIALQTISDNAQIPLEVYKPDGKKIGVHLP
ncbi:MAG: hypothetical protein WBA77_11940 [Microcoleaceae cyanobacterium]